jgi:hypothetical protein
VLRALRRQVKPTTSAALRPGATLQPARSRRPMKTHQRRHKSPRKKTSAHS